MGAPSWRTGCHQFVDFRVGSSDQLLPSLSFRLLTHRLHLRLPILELQSLYPIHIMPIILYDLHSRIFARKTTFLWDPNAGLCDYTCSPEFKAAEMLYYPFTNPNPVPIPLEKPQARNI